MANAQVQAPPSQTPVGRDSGDKYIVTFQSGTSQADRAASIRRAGASVRFNYSIVDAAAVTVPNVNALAALQRDISVLNIVPDHKIFAIQAPGAGPLKGKPGGNNGSSNSQIVPAGVQRVGAAASGSDGTGIGVLVADTGIDLDHPDLVANIAPQRIDAFGGDCNDANGHGTHVSGIIAAADNAIDVVGVAPKAMLYCGKALDNSGSGTDSTLIAVLDWAFDNRNSVFPNIRVVNMSLGRPKVSGDIGGPLELAIQRLYSVNIVVVTAAGNDASQEVKDMVPAGFPEVLAVASTTAKDGSNGCRLFSGKISKDTASYFTTDGMLDITLNIGVTISAPGEDQENISKGCFVSSTGILSLKAGGGTTRMSGTSMAAPHLSGIVARIFQTASATTVEKVRDYIRSNAYLSGTAPLNSPTSGYTFDGEREGVAKAP